MGAKSWPPWEVKRSEQTLDILFELIKQPESDREETTSWLTRLLVVRLCGHLEQTVLHCTRQYVVEKSGGMVQSFSLSWLERSRNPSSGALESHIRRFDEKLANDFAQFLDYDGRRLADELNYLVTARNRIAHGENEGLRRDRAIRLESATKEICDWWILTFNPFIR